MRWQGSLVLLVLLVGAVAGPRPALLEVAPLAEAPAEVPPDAPEQVLVTVFNGTGPLPNATVHWTLPLSVTEDALPEFMELRLASSTKTNEHGQAWLDPPSGRIRIEAAGHRPYEGPAGPVLLSLELPPDAIAHRGASKYAPENTLAAAILARTMGADRIEFDLRMTVDGHMVAMHDSLVDRTTNGTGAVAAMTGAEIQRLDAGSWFHDDYAGEPVPTLQDIASWWVKNRTPLLLELKVDPAREAAAMEATLEIASMYGMLPDVEIASFSPITAHGCLGTLWRCGWILPTDTDRRDDALVLASSLRIPFVVAPVRFVDEGFVSEAHEEGIDVYAYTANKHSTIADLKALGVDGIVTDRPERLLY